jgi:hemerythrin-like domain-containing protein
MKERAQTIKTRVQYDDPLEVLSREHDYGSEYLDKLHEAVGSIQKNGFSVQAFLQITDSTQYIAGKMRQHNIIEERYLFSKLDRHVFESPNAIRHERREMWQAFNELMMSVKDVEEGRIHGTTIRELIHSAEMVVERFRNQIEKENTIIFPMVKRIFTPDEYALLTQEIALAL